MVLPPKFIDQIYRDFRLSKDPTPKSDVDNPKDPRYNHDEPDDEQFSDVLFDR